MIAEEFDTFEHPNLQVALDDYLSRDGHRADLVGMAAENKRFMGFGLSDLLSRRLALPEGPVDYVNFHPAGDRVLSCVQFGLYLVRDGDARLVALVAGPSFGGPRPRLRVEVAAGQREQAQAFLAELLEGMRRLNVYRDDGALHVVFYPPSGLRNERSSFLYRADGQPPTLPNRHQPFASGSERLAEHWFRALYRD